MADHKLDALAFPGADEKTLVALQLHYLKKTVRSFLDAGEGLTPEWRRGHARVAALAAAALKKNPKALLECFRAPAVATPIHCRAHRSRWPELGAEIEAAFRGALAQLPLELAARGLLADDQIFDWDLAAPRLLLPSIRAAILPPPDARGWRFSANGVAVIGGDGDGSFLRLNAQSLTRGRKAVYGLRSELGYVALAGEICLALVDSNPIARTEAHPDKSGSALSLGDHSEDDWRSSLQMALDWIDGAAPELGREMRLLLREIVPVGFDAERHFSASYQESIGVVYASLHPNPLVMAEALIHEFQHNKLYLASYWDALLENAFEPLYPSPVRPDPRPLWGILLGAHALLAVAFFYRRLRAIGHSVAKTPYFTERLAQLDAQNDEALETLERHARWTKRGEGLRDGLRALRGREADAACGGTLAA